MVPVRSRPDLNNIWPKAGKRPHVCPNRTSSRQQGNNNARARPRERAFPLYCEYTNSHLPLVPVTACLLPSTRSFHASSRHHHRDCPILVLALRNSVSTLDSRLSILDSSYTHSLSLPPPSFFIHTQFLLPTSIGASIPSLDCIHDIDSTSSYDEPFFSFADQRRQGIRNFSDSAFLLPARFEGFLRTRL